MSDLEVEIRQNEVFPNNEDKSCQPSANEEMSRRYNLPENYNPAEYPPVKYRHPAGSERDRSEAQRKRRSKNRLSNRRSTGYVSSEMIEEALKLGGNPDYNSGTLSNQENNQ